jgi:hypothetical protein
VQPEGLGELKNPMIWIYWIYIYIYIYVCMYMCVCQVHNIPNDRMLLCAISLLLL